ncbi:MAG: cache domain-containing protein [Lachnospiraceae bacterium]|nr:cache domain-containing protein [Lachnospiraceae bacterium]
MKLKAKMITIAMIPLVVVTVITCIVLSIRVTSVIGSQVKDNLLSIALLERDNIGMDEGNDYHLDESGNLWNGSTKNITEEIETVEQIKKDTNVDVTIFYGDTRYMTTIKDGGKSVLGTKAGDVVIEKVLQNGENYFSEDVDVLGNKYYGMYIPYYGDDTRKPEGIIFTGMTRKYVEQEISNITLTIIGVMVVIALLAGGLVYILVSQVSKRICYGVNALGEIAKGNLCQTVDDKMLKSKDESGEIIKAVQVLQKELIRVVSGIAGNSEEVYSVAIQMNESVNGTQRNLEQVEHAVSEIAAGAASQADDTEKATENIITMDNLIQETKENVNRLSKNADNMEHSGFEAKETLDSLRDVNNQVEVAIDTIYEQTNNTNESAQKISEAINIITSIAEETNLLALNASIEAARAGEQGKGFAVVASEIQSLAEQSNASAMKIGENILKLTKDSETAVTTMEQVKQIMLEQSEMVEKTDKRFHEVLSGIETSRKDIGYISGNAKELDESREQVVGIVQNLSTMSEEYAASAEQTSTSVTEVNTSVQEIAANTDSLQKIVEELKESVKTFHL